MVTTRRMNGITTPSKSAPPSTAPLPNTTSSNTMPPNPLLPTPTELVLLSIYPLTLLTGSAFSHFSPLTRPPHTASTYSHTHQSFQPPEAAPSYFAQKRNVFNVYFVKIGWFWCSLALLLFALFGARGRPSSPSSSSPSTPRRYLQTAARYGLCTLAWVLVTQWCGGAPVVDRGFAWTGGRCEGAPLAPTAAKCRAAGGVWQGGYDISGHVFILVLGSGMLWLEMLPFLVRRARGRWLAGGGDGRVVMTERGDVGTVGGVVGPVNIGGGSAASTQQEKPLRRTRSLEPGSLPARLKVYATSLALGIAVLSWWMLLMTAAFFHTWFEKVTGLVFAFAALWGVYFAPRGLPAVRGVLGLPGV